jgi:hypothetical protein
MPLDDLGRDNWQRKKKIKTMILVVVVAVFSGIIIAGFILYSAYKK